MAELTPEQLAERMKAQPWASVLEPLMTKITLIVLRNAQPRTPVRTGTLRRSETTAVERGGLRGWVGSNLIYAPFVHRRVPFLTDALADSRAAIDRELQKAGDDYWRSVV